MTAFFVGNGLGVERSSAWVLGARAQLAALGQAATGRAHDNAYVNAATGNLVIQNLDEMLFGVGPEALIARTYNSRASGTDDNGDNWRASIQRVVSGLTGTVNTSGSTITRTDWDGSVDVYTYSSSLGGYVFKASGEADRPTGVQADLVDPALPGPNGNAQDTLTYASGTGIWTWTDGASRLQETYDSANGGRITGSTDTLGNSLVYTYTSGKLTRVATSNGEYTDLTWSGNNLTQLVTTYDRDGISPIDTMTRVRYGYDASNRLTSVTVDLSPTDNSIATGSTYVTNYTYDGTSTRVASITQTDGSSLAIHYDTSNRVDQLTQTSASGVTRVTSLSYSATYTQITDASGQVTKLTFDSSKRLTQIDAPAAVSGGSAQVTQFTYDTDGNVVSITDPLGHVTTYGYDTKGNRIWDRDNLGNEITRTFDPSTNALLTETRWTGIDPDAGGTGSSPTGGMTTRFAYDGNNRLRFVVSAEGNVTEYSYDDGVPKKQSAITYNANRYDVSSLSATTPLALSTMTSWLSGISNKSTTSRTDTTYDFRGNVSIVTSFSKVLSSGAGDTSAEYTTINYVYDQAGNLLKRKVEGATNWEVYAYDGLNRLTSTTDYNNVVTTIDFLDSSSITRVTLANGLQKTSTYNLAGELITYAESGTGVNTSTTAYAYDNLGRLRRVTDPSTPGVKSFILYDRVGRKVADIDGDGSLTEYKYNADNLLIATVRYKTLVSSTLLSQLDTNVANQTYELSAYRPSADAADVWEWRVYDGADRLVEVIDGAGAASTFAYDGASRLTSVTAYANLIASGTVSGFKTTPPTTLQTPTADSTNDRVARNFYDNDGRLTGTLDAEGYLTKIVYDAAGRKTETIAYSGATSTTYRASGTFAQLLGSLTVDTTKDIHNWFVYDQRGFLMATIDGEGNLTKFHYTALGYKDQEIRGQKLSSTELNALFSTAPTLSTLPSAASGTKFDTTAWTYDLYGRIQSETRTLASAATETDVYTYDSATKGLLLLKTTLSGASDARDHRYWYDLRGRLTREVWGVGAATLGASPTQTQIDTAVNTYGIRYAYDDADRMISKIVSDGSGTTGNKTLYYYNVDGQLTHEINALGEVTEYRYDGLGRRTDTIAYGTRIGSTTLATLTGGLVNSTLTTAITGITNSGVDRQTTLAYNVTGTIAQSTDALGSATTFAYNAFRELTTETDPIDTGVTVARTFAYDRKGLLKTSTVDGSGLNLQTQALYDAFGRQIQTTDALGRTRSTGYDRAGRVVTSTDAQSHSTTFTYDGRGNILTRTDRTGAVTTFTNDEFSRNVTMTTQEGIVTTTVNNAYGQTLTVTDGAGRATSFTYDKDGALKTTVVDPGASHLALTTTNTYDNAGRLSYSIDAVGSKTSFTYDAANRTLTRKLDDGGLNLTTTWVYDPFNQAIQETDGSGVVTTIAFDKNGRKTTMVVDPGAGHLALTTSWAYDKRGRVLSVTDAAGGVTHMAYDNADRLRFTVDPTGAVQQYQYDANGNAVAKTVYAATIAPSSWTLSAISTAVSAIASNPGNGTTRYVYDEENRLIWSVDPVGGVVRTDYDYEGRVIMTRAYAALVPSATLAGWGAAITAATITGAVSTGTNDEVTYFVYDRDGRLTYQVDGLKQACFYDYDGAGNVKRKVEYAAPIILPGGTLTVANLGSAVAAIANTTNDRVTRFVFDGANRQVYSIDAMGGVTGYAYDGAGRVTQVRGYETAYTLDLDAHTQIEMNSWSAGLSTAQTDEDRITRTVYDGAGRAAFSLNAVGGLAAYSYDGAGRVKKVVQYANLYTASGSPTLSDLQTWSSAQATANDHIARTLYDGAGRARYQVVAERNVSGTENYLVTEFQYNGLGQVTQQIRYATRYTTISDSTTTSGLASLIGALPATAQVTARTYDAAGRLTAETRGYGASEASTTSWEYDGVGRVTKETRASNAATALQSVTTYSYDAASQLTKEVVDPTGLNLQTDYVYDAFGNRVKVTDRRRNDSFFYYDALNRLVLEVDPQKYATETAYSLGGEVVSVRHRMKPVVGAVTETAWPTFDTDTSGDEITTIARDKVDRVTGSTDATGATETYGLNAFGDRTAVTNKLGGITNNVFDKLGRLVQETLPVKAYRADGSQTTTNIVNTYTYDAFGNLYQQIEASGFTEARTTTYGYDKLNQRTTTTHNSVTVTNPLTRGTTPSVSVVETVAYDARGNVIETVDAAGAHTQFWYDLLDRKIAQLDALGALSTWTYDTRSNALTQRTYGDPLTVGTWSATVPSPINSSNYRETTFTWDKLDRQLTVSSPSVTTGYWSGSSYVTSAGAITTTTTYDGGGNVIKQTDGRNNSIFTYYDKAGHKVGQVDEERYLTTWAVDGDGNVLTEVRYATAISGSTTISTSSDPFVLDDSLAAANDRTTVFTYDKAGRRLTEKRLNVTAYTVSGSGVLSSDSTGYSLITYTYNGLGEVLTKTEANGDTTTYAYDVAGRQTQVSEASFTDYQSNTVAPTTDQFYDGLNNLVRVREGKASSSSIDRITTYAYGAGGRLASTTDAAGNTHTYGYDAAGRVTTEAWSRVKADGSTTINELNASSYDLLGRVVWQTIWAQDPATSTWSAGDVTRTKYNTFGEVTDRGIGTTSVEMYQEHFEYDAAGRLWRTNSGDGTQRVLFYDANGNNTATVASSGTGSVSSYSSASAALSGLTSGGSLGSVALTGLTVTLKAFDKRNQETETREPFREMRFNASNPAIIDTSLVAHSRTYNAFGEVLQETDALGHTTNYSYNALGRLVQTLKPVTSWTSESGTVTTVASGFRPQEDYYFDRSGRLVASSDANGNVTRRLLLAGSGHGDDEAKTIAEFHADNSSTATGRDVFGDDRKFTNELGYIETRDYDGVGRLTTLTRPSRGSSTPGGAVAGLVEYYAYDSLGQRIAHTNSQLAPTMTSLSQIFTMTREKTDYDSQNRVISSIDFSNYATTWSYSFSTTLETTGLATGSAAFGGWTITTNLPSGPSSTEKKDYFGRTVDKVDFGAHDYAYGFDLAGRLVTQTNSYGQNLVYTYFNTGLTATIQDGYDTTPAEGESYNYRVTTYGYDEQGRRVVEKLSQRTRYWVWEQTYPGDEYNPPEYSWQYYDQTRSLQNASATYDELNRLKTVTDTGEDATRPISVSYDYDKNGNVRRVQTTYESVIDSANKTQDYWYKYDSMNRFVTSKGTLSGGVIVRGNTGIDVVYDAAGQRVRATYKMSSINGTTGATSYTYDRREDYAYTEDGYLSVVRIAEGTSGTPTPTAAGNIRGTDVRDAMGRVTTHTEYKENGTTVSYSRVVTYAYNSSVTQDVVSVLDTDNATTVSTTTYGYLAETTPGNGVWTGQYMGGQVTHMATEVHRIGTGGAWVEKPDTDTQYRYAWWDSTRQTDTIYDSNTGSSTNAIWATTLTYDASAHLQAASVADGRPRSVAYLTDANGQVMSRKESSSATNNPINLYYYFNGMRVGDVTNDGPSDQDYATVINKRNASAPSGPFKFGTRAEFADFDQSYDALNPNSDRQSGYSYTVQDGDTLQSIAQATWGDANLWYLLADANGLSLSDPLVAGMAVTVPAKVSNVHNNADTFRPYDPNEAIGNVFPNKPPPGKKGCGVVGQIIVVVIAKVVEAILNAYMPGAGTLVGKIIVAAASEAAAQGAAVALGIQDKFDWNAVGIAAVTAGVTAKMKDLKVFAKIAETTDRISKVFPKGTQPFVSKFLQGAARSTITQGALMATGLQRRFNWTAVAAAGMTNGVVGDAWTGMGRVGEVVNGMASAMVNAATRSLLNGEDFGDNIRAALPDIIGSTIGDVIATNVCDSLIKHEDAPGNASAETAQGFGDLGYAEDLEPRLQGIRFFMDNGQAADVPASDLTPEELDRKVLEALAARPHPNDNYVIDPNTGQLSQPELDFGIDLTSGGPKPLRLVPVDPLRAQLWKEQQLGTTLNYPQGVMSPEEFKLRADIVSGSVKTAGAPSQDRYSAANLELGVNSQFSSEIVAAARRRGMTPQTVAAIISAEAAIKPHSGGMWDPESANGDTSARGLTQFLAGTWVGEGERPGTWLNDRAKSLGYLDSRGRISATHRDDFLKLRFNSEDSINAAVDYADYNLSSLRADGFIKDETPGALAKYAYIAHHEGLPGARAFLRGAPNVSEAVFNGNITSAKTREKLLRENGNDRGKAYLAHMKQYIDSRIDVRRFMVNSQGVEVPPTQNLLKTSH